MPCSENNRDYESIFYHRIMGNPRKLKVIRVKPFEPNAYPEEHFYKRNPIFVSWILNNSLFFLQDSTSNAAETTKVF